MKLIDKKKIANEYTSFMGSWMAGTLIGHYIAKIAVFIFLIWFLSKCMC